MERDTSIKAVPHCPSAQPSWEGSRVLGIVGGTVEGPRLAYLKTPHPPTEELLALTQPVEPTEVMRFTAPCASQSCEHFDGANCRLVKKMVHLMPAVQDTLTPCYLRPNCRWWQQEGQAACVRCPQIVTKNYYASEALSLVADPSVP